MDESLIQRARRIVATTRLAGWSGPVSYWFGRRISRLLPRGRKLSLRSRFARARLVFRTGTSDLDVFHQIFVDREYRCLDDLTDAKLIIDCGANVGYSAAYFLNRFPRCRLIAVEPERGNFAVLSENLRPFADRCSALQMGVWSRKVGLRISEKKFGDGREWAVSLEEAEPNETSQIEGIDIASLLALSGCDRISILKIDIEGSEKRIFAEGAHQWLERVDTLVVELHGAECHDVFQRAISQYDFELSTCDELTIARRRSTSRPRTQTRGVLS
jgi:FkbM family methyltransferase